MIRGFPSVPEDLRGWVQWINSIEERGEFTATLTGMTSATTGTVEWVKIGRRITLSLLANLTGTSNTTAMTMTGLPAKFEPTNNKEQLCVITDNGSPEFALASLSTVTITFLVNSPFSATGFTNSGTKGLRVGWQFSFIYD